MARLRMKPPIEDIVNYFNNISPNVFKRSDVEKILAENREFWRFSGSVTVHKFIEFMLENTKLEIVKFEFPSRNILRYTWGKTPFYEIVVSLLPNSYFTHYTAMFLHELTEQIPNTIYLNSEQSRKIFGTKELEQSRIDAAFKRNVRVSRNIGSYNNQKICILNGMYTGQLGVIEKEDHEGARILTTNIERTLIDIAVRPIYSGGVFEVQKAYKMAKGRVSVNRLSAMLKKLNYTYPYHQAIGFYLENAGVYNKSSIKLLKKFDMKYDFYLNYKMADMVYSKKWRLYYPKGL